MAASPAPPSWRSFLIYSLCTVVWIQLFPLALAAILVQDAIFSAHASSTPWLHRIMRTVWRVDLLVHRLYDESTTEIALPSTWTSVPMRGIAACTCAWKIVQRGMFAMLDASVVRAFNGPVLLRPFALVLYVASHMFMIQASAWVISMYIHDVLYPALLESSPSGRPTANQPPSSTQLDKSASPPSQDTPKANASNGSTKRRSLAIDTSAPLISMEPAPAATNPSIFPAPHASKSTTYYTLLSPPRAPPSSSSSAAAPSYGMLSPPRAASRHEFAPTYRSLRDEPPVQDDVHFHAFAPSMVSPSSCFRFDVFAFLVSQRDEMLEQALHQQPSDSSTKLVRDQLLRVRRGALAHVSLEVPAGFELYDEPTQALEWSGDVTSVQYQVLCMSNAPVGQVLFKSTIVVGAKVMILRSYVFVGRQQIEYDQSTRELRCNLEVLPPTFHEIQYKDLHIQDLVGQGHFGDAYRATYNGREVVVKTVRGNEFGERSDMVEEEFRHEAAVLNMFGHHPHIVPFVGACTDISQPLCLVTEYLPCGNIEDQYGHALTARQKEVILGDAASGFLNIHEGGFVHRDIAARNCLVDANFRAKVCDFGMCRRVSANCGCHIQTHSGVGPIKYMAPETLLPPHAFTYKSDVYAFGVLMWETFVEAPPFADIPAAQAAARVLEGGRLDHVRGEIPPKYQDLIAQCFQEDPAKRPTMVDLMNSFRKCEWRACSFSAWLASHR